jgi:uncharacterized protein (DUF934 family)
MKFIDPKTDSWHEVTADDSLVAVPAPAANRILSLAQWKEVHECWPATLPKGLAIPNDVDIETLEAEFPKFQLIALTFPKWVDGRAYTQARLLRSRYRFKGEVRATGEVLVDMLPLLQRTGFDSVVLRADQDLAAAQRALGFFKEFYQGDVIDHQPHFAKVNQKVSP